MIQLHLLYIETHRSHEHEIGVFLILLLHFQDLNLEPQFSLFISAASTNRTEEV